MVLLREALGLVPYFGRPQGDRWSISGPFLIEKATQDCLARLSPSNQCMNATGKGATQGGPMKSPVVKRSIIIGGHKTSVSLEDAFWSDLKEIAHSQGATLSKLVAQIDDTRQQGNLSSAIRLYVLEQIRTHGKDDPKERGN